MIRGTCVVFLATAAVAGGCGSSSTPSAQKPPHDKTTPATAVLTTTAPAATPPGTTSTQAKVAPKRRPGRPSAGAHHGQAPLANVPGRAGVGSPRFARRVSAACKATRVPPPPRTVTDVGPRRALAAAKRLSQLSERLSRLRPPRVAQGPYLNLEQTYARLKALYGFAGAGRLTRSQLRAQLLPGIQATHSQVANAATVLGATGCVTARH